MTDPKEASTMARRDLLCYLTDHIVSIEKLPLGMTNDNYRCILNGGQSYVIRFPGKGSEYLVNRAHEQKVLNQISLLGIDVNTIYYEVESGVKITKFVDDSKTFNGTETQMIEFGVKMLKKIHESKIQFCNEFDFWSRIEGYLDVCLKFGINIESRLTDMLNKLRITSNLIIPEKPVVFPCHNDPVPQNFLTTKTGDIFLIDWEYAGMNDPVWDLAAFSIELRLDAIEEANLLFCYYGSEHNYPELRHRMLLYKIYQDFLWYVWSKIRIFFGQNILNYASMRYTRGVQNYSILTA